MAFRNSAVSIPLADTPTTVYTCPAGREVVIHSLFISNTNLIDSIEVDITVTLNNNGNPSALAGTTYYLSNNVPIPAKNMLMLDKPINLRPGDSINVTSTIATCEIVANYLSVPEDATAAA